MSVEDTLAERGKRYGDFSDHAEICQRLKLAMIAGSAWWTRLSDVQKQALEVIADKIARILSGDPNYADNWHDIQGYAKLVEDRLPREAHADYEQAAGRMKRTSSTGGVRQEGETIIVTTDEQRRALYAALKSGLDVCPECEYPDDGTGTHYATCSKLTAPEGFVAEVEVTFDELEGVDPVAESASKIDNTAALDEFRRRTVEATLRTRTTAEPAAEIDDESPRAQAIGQNGNTGEHYDDPWAGAPEWAKYKAQDGNGEWRYFDGMPTQGEDEDRWHDYGDGENPAEHVSFNVPNPNWRDTLIERP